MTVNALKNSALDAFQVPRNVYNAIRKASSATGVNFSYMIEKAAAESNFNATAKARTSSATGLYQFIESTWLGMVRDHGDKYGLSGYADKIDARGKVSDAKTRAEILELRNDPEIASYMAAEFASSNHNHLKQRVGGDIGSTELYFAHFMGAGGASNFLNAMKKSPHMAAADLFPREARANRNVFYDSKTGAPRSLQQVYDFFDRKFQSGTTMMAGASEAATSPLRQTAAQNQTNQMRTATAQESILRTNAETSLARQSAQARNNAAVIDNGRDPFARLSSIMGLDLNTRAMDTYTQKPASSMMRLAGTDHAHITDATTRKAGGWQIFPPSLYNRLSLSPAQLMLLSNFKV